MRRNIFFVVMVVFGFFLSVTKASADCPSYWTEAYKRQNCPGYGGGNARPTYTPPPVYQPSPQELKQQQAVALSNQGVDAARRGDYPEARRLYERALEMGAMNATDTRKTLDIIGRTYNTEGRAAVNRGDYDEALRLDKLALEYAQRSNSQQEIRTANTNIAMDYLRQSKLANGKSDFQEELRLFELAVKYDPNGKFKDGTSYLSELRKLRAEIAAVKPTEELSLELEQPKTNDRREADRLKEKRELERVEAALLAAKQEIDLLKKSVEQRQREAQDAKAKQDEARKLQAQKDEQEKQRRQEAMNRAVGAAAPSDPAKKINDDWVCPTALPNLFSTRRASISRTGIFALERTRSLAHFPLEAGHANQARFVTVMVLILNYADNLTRLLWARATSARATNRSGFIKISTSR